MKLSWNKELTVSKPLHTFLSHFQVCTYENVRPFNSDYWCSLKFWASPGTAGADRFFPGLLWGPSTPGAQDPPAAPWQLQSCSFLHSPGPPEQEDPWPLIPFLTHGVFSGSWIHCAVPFLRAFAHAVSADWNTLFPTKLWVIGSLLGLPELSSP